MSRLLFRDHEYSFKALLELYNNSPLYKNGETIDMETGECFDIADINIHKENYFEELVSKKHKKNILKKLDEKNKYEQLEIKYHNRKISKSEMLEYLSFMDQNKLEPNYNYEKGYIIVNLNKLPNKISDSDYGKFNKMLTFISYSRRNMLEYNNEKPIKKKDISEFLKFNKVEYFNKFLRRLKKENLLDEDIYGGIKYLIINPAYAKKNMAIDSTIYKMFKNDLQDCLTEEQKYYLELEDENIEISSLIAIED